MSLCFIVIQPLVPLTTWRAFAILAQYMLQHYRHIIWDWNGTLLDDAWLSVEIINTLLRKRGLPVTDHQRYQREFDFPVRGYYQRIGFDFALYPYEELATEFIELWDQRYVECTLRAHALQVVKALAADGHQQTILSASEQKRLEEMVGIFPELHGCFSRLIGVEDYYAVSKLDHGRRLIAELAHAPAEVVLIGDTTHDFAVAQAMGIASILIPSGHHPREKLAQCDALIVESLAELI